MKTINYQLIGCILIIITSANNLYEIQQRFKEKETLRSSLKMPEIKVQYNLQDQLEVYSKIHQSVEFKSFKADAEFSSQMLLQKNGSWNQSIFFKGKQLHNLLMEVTVIHIDKSYTNENQSIQLYLINIESNEIIRADKIKHVRLFKIQLVSELYELRIRYDWSKQSNLNASQTQSSKHISINIDIDPVVVSDSQDEKDEVAAHEKLSKIKQQTDRVFITSLDIWQEIQEQHAQFFENEKEVYLRAYFQLLIVFAINCIELLVLRKTLKLKSLI